MTSAPDRTTTSPLLVTKLFIPPLHTNVVARPQLVDRFQDGIDRKLTTVTAPAGSGKTTLVVEWYAATGRNVPLAWFSLDTGENDPIRFLLYLTSAVRTIHPAVGSAVMDSLHSSQPASPDYLLAELLNDISKLAEPFVLVLDDLHLITNPVIHRQLGFLLDNLPPEMRLVITSRTDPPLPLARLRASGQVSEFHTSDLRFSSAEVLLLYNQVMALDLDEQLVASLADQTEGWVAGLMLAGISLQQHGNAATFINNFTGSNRYIFDYLAEEVLMWQPEELQDFLLQTSILSRMCAGLCDAVTGRNDGQASLEMIESAHLFLVALDDVRRWYRYHHLFGSFLAERLRQQQPDRIAELHRRASRWFADNGSIIEAVEHALQAQDYDYVVELVGRHGMPMVLSGQLRTVLEWIEMIPPELVEDSPRLNGVLVWGLILSGDLDGAWPVLDRIEHSLETRQIDPQLRENFKGQAALARSTIARLQGNIPDTLRYGEQAAEYLQGGEHSAYGASQVHLAYACLMRGNLGEARRLLEDALPAVDQFSSPLVQADLRHILSQVCISEGKLSEAAAICAEMIERSKGTDQLGLVVGNTVLAEILRERNQLAEAERIALHASEIASRVGLIHTFTSASVQMARIRLDQGDLKAADALIDEVDQAARRAKMSSYVDHNLNELRLRAAITADDPGRAQRYALPVQVDVPESLDFVRGGELIANARLLIATGQVEDAMSLLDRMEWHLTVNGVHGLLPEVLMLRAIAQDEQQDRDDAVATMARSLEWGEPEGYVRVYLHDNLPVSRLLQRLLQPANWEKFAAPRNISEEYVRSLLDAAGVAVSGEQLSTSANESLAEPLTGRELEVLRLLASGKSNRVIAEDLFITTGTIKTHTHNIYQKLGVRNRTQAINSARELGIIE